MASILVGQEVHGDAILVAIGTSSKSLGTMFYEDINLSSYHRSVFYLILWWFKVGCFNVFWDLDMLILNACLGLIK